MITTPELPLPRLSRGRFASFYAYTDEALFAERSIRVAFTERGGGLSEGPFAALNLGMNTEDTHKNTQENRRLVMRAFGVEGAACLIPCQVHESTICRIREEDPAPLDTLAALNEDGVDAVLVEQPHVAALLCFADCVPLIIVSPTGRFVVVHAGWRGVMRKIAVETLIQLRECDAEAGFAIDPAHYNVYIGPYIHNECFEVAQDVHESFVEHFGQGCAADDTHIDLGAALRSSLSGVGVEDARIADVGVCTVCENERFFSYRAQGGVCGRHGAFGMRM